MTPAREFLVMRWYGKGLNMRFDQPYTIFHGTRKQVNAFVDAKNKHGREYVYYVEPIKHTYAGEPEICLKPTSQP